jgi:hypothetical protein
MRRLGAASREASFRVFPSESPPGFSALIFNMASFSPNSRLVVFSDRGPGSDGSDAVQLVSLDTESGRRTQLTTFAAASQTENTQLRAFFIDEDTVIGYARETPGAGERPGELSAFTVKPDGTDFRPLDPPVLIPGSHVIQNFAIAGAHGTVFTAALAQETADPFPGPVQELFIQQDARVLQLTNFGRAETSAGVLSGPRVFFAASADPFGLNRTHACQLFSVNQLGGDLRQLTRWDAPIPSLGGCFTFEEAPSCSGGVSIAHTIDPVTHVLITDSSCDPFGLGTIGDQLFALRADGSGLRQLTAYRGMVVEPDGTVTVELPGPVSYSGLRNH